MAPASLETPRLALEVAIPLEQLLAQRWVALDHQLAVLPITLPPGEIPCLPVLICTRDPTAV